jgi:hypothetical protein
VLDDGVFQIDGAVVGSDGNAEGGMAHGGAGFKSGKADLQTANFSEFRRAIKLGIFQPRMDANQRE